MQRFFGGLSQQRLLGALRFLLFFDMGGLARLSGGVSRPRRQVYLDHVEIASQFRNCPLANCPRADHPAPMSQFHKTGSPEVIETLQTMEYVYP